MRGAVRGDHHPDDHDQQRYDLAGDPGRRAVELLVQERGPEPDRDDRVADGDDREDRRDQGALLEGVLVEEEAERSYHSQRVDRPVGEHHGQAAADIRDHDLDEERRDAVVDAARERERERPEELTPPSYGEAAQDPSAEARSERQDDEEPDAGLAVGRLCDGQESGQPGRAGNDAADQEGIPPPAEVGIDEDGEDQAADQERLDQRQRPEPERENLETEAGQGPADRCQPQGLAHQVEEDPRRQRFAALDPLGAALIGHGRDAEHQCSDDGEHYGEKRGQLCVLTPQASCGSR